MKMTPQNYTESEIGLLFDKALPFIKKRKIRFIIFYLVFVLYFSLPAFQIPLLEYGHIRITSLMEQRAIENNLLFYPRQSWADFDEINPDLFKAIISMEDGKFFYHKGIDWEQVNKALRLDKRKGRAVRGASTITMQLARNLFLTTHKSFLRKAKEIVITLRMEKELTKKAILLDYVNVVEWGNGIFGIKEASEKYFNKEPKNLTKYECARLAAVLPSPLIHKPNQNSSYVLRRAGIILNRLDDVILFPKN